MAKRGQVRMRPLPCKKFKQAPQGSAYHASSYCLRVRARVDDPRLKGYRVLYEVKDEPISSDTEEETAPLKLTKSQLKRKWPSHKTSNVYEAFVDVPLTEGKRSGPLIVPRKAKAKLLSLKPWEYLKASTDPATRPDVRAVLKTIECTVLSMRTLRRDIIDDIRDGMPFRRSQRGLFNFVSAMHDTKIPNLRCKLEERYGRFCLREIKYCKSLISTLVGNRQECRFACLASKNVGRAKRLPPVALRPSAPDPSSWGLFTTPRAMTRPKGVIAGLMFSNLRVEFRPCSLLATFGRVRDRPWSPDHSGGLQRPEGSLRR